MTVLGGSLFTKLSNQELITPYVLNAFSTDEWLDDTLSIFVGPHDSWTDDYFHPSTHTTADARLLYYQLHPEHRKNLVPWRPTPGQRVSMLMGTCAHVVIQQKLKWAGLATDDDIEVPLVHEGLHARGHLDIRVKHPHKGTVLPVDIKTANPESFGYMRSLSEEYNLQLQCYMDWLGVDEGVVFVQMMGYPWSTKEFRVTRDEALLRGLYDKWTLVREHLAINVPPARMCCGLGSAQMKNCSARLVCMSDYNGEGS